MGEILGLGCTHRPPMMRRNDRWTIHLRATLDDPDLPKEWKNPGKWPPKLREELGNDFGMSAAGRAREVYKDRMLKARKVLDDFKPDVVIMWGDDQYENFQDDMIPPFCVMAYDDQDIKPWKDNKIIENPWGEGHDFTYHIRGHREAGKYLASKLIEAGFDMPYSYKPIHHSLAHAFKYTILLLDHDRVGFQHPVVPFHVNCYGRRVIQARGLRLPLAMRNSLENLDPPAPNPSRCMQVGAAVARIMAESPYRVALVASASWSHAFLTEKNHQLWPDIDADRRMFSALRDGDYDVWRNRTTLETEQSGQQEILNWHCLMGAMEELGRKPDHSEFIESWALTANVVFAYYRP
jgi:hypothetical protein